MEVIELRGVQIVLLDEPYDAQIWVSLEGYDVPASSECFCWAGGDTRAEAVAEAVRLFRDAADRLEAMEKATAVPAGAQTGDEGEAIGSARKD